MNKVSRTISGIATIVWGGFLIYVGILWSIWISIYGLPIFIIGFFILFNKNEDKIEEINNNNENK